MDGLEAIKKLRANSYEGIIIGLTGDADPEDIQAFLRSGADDCLIKPITYSQLEKCIAVAIVRKASKNKHAEESAAGLRNPSSTA
jgi:DNA-binding response OmpR family regulator